MLENIVINLINWSNGKTENIDFEMTGKWLQLMKVSSDFDRLYAAREFGAGLEGNAIQHYPKLKVFEEQILNKIAVSEASVERLFSRRKQIHSPLRASLGNDLVTDCLLIRISRQYIEAETTDKLSLT